MLSLPLSNILQVLRLSLRAHGLRLYFIARVEVVRNVDDGYVLLVKGGSRGRSDGAGTSRPKSTSAANQTGIAVRQLTSRCLLRYTSATRRHGLLP